MKIRRRMTFQLTPLLDLLLIVIFAQSMEVRQQSNRIDGELQAERAKIVQHFESLENQFQQKQQAAEKQFSLRESALRESALRESALRESALAETRERYAKQFDGVLEQQKQAGQVLADSLNLPGRVMEQVLKLRNSNRSEEAESLKAASEQLSELLESREEKLLQFLLRVNEMEKHVSIWELYLQENGKAILTDGQQTTIVSFRTADEFVTQAVQGSKAFTEPKPLVIILLSYGDAQAGQRSKLTESMPSFLNRLRTDSGNVRWFDYSIMGFRASGPVLDSNR